MNAEKHNLDRIYFGGGFIRGERTVHSLSSATAIRSDRVNVLFTGHAATISTLSYAIRFWSKGTKRALFLRHEGYLGGIGAWLKNLEPTTPPRSEGSGERGRERTRDSSVEEGLGKLGLSDVEGVEGGIREK